jgi:5-bromo-4-chloroindolyl phosphate hydrolysis protein
MNLLSDPHQVEDNMTSQKKLLIAGAGAAAVFVGGLMGFSHAILGVILDFAAAATIGGGLYMVLGEDKTPAKQMLAELPQKAGVDNREVVEAIQMGKSKLGKIREAAGQIRAPNTQRRINKICEIGDKIVEDFRVDPSDVKLARSWLGTYLDQTLDIVTKYAQLSRTGARNLEAQKIMAQCEETLDLLEQKFQELLDKLLANNVMDLDVDMTVLNNMLKQEGI